MKSRVLLGIVILSLVVALSVGAVWAAKPGIFYSQLGYGPNEPKFFVLEKSAATFQLMGANDNKPVFEGKVEGPVADISTGNSYWQGNFSAFTQPGNYYLLVDGKLRSQNFAIGTDVWQNAQRLVLRSYYLQRCGIDIKDEESKIRHRICHQNDGFVCYKDDFHKSGEKLDEKGGWHDAGDYGKYISSTAISVYVMLSAYELYPDRLAADNTAVVESGNGIPDLLDENRWALDWMLKMQRPDGGVYHKVGGSTWPGGVLPEADPTTRYIYAVSSSATAKFATTLAYSARIYKKSDPAYADKLLKAAELSWKFLQTASFLPDPIGNDNAGSGPYGDDSIKDDLFATAVELYLSTGDKSYQTYALANIPNKAEIPGWMDGSIMAMYHYIVAVKDNGAKEMSSLIQDAAKECVERASKSAFGISMVKEEFAWSSNKTVMGKSILLILANRIAPNPDYIKVAYTQLHYIFGLNPLAKSFVTGLGANPVVHPHQRMHWATGHLVPGEMAGGPNNSAQSGIESPNLGALSYADDQNSYSSNEYAVDLNANLLFVLASAVH